MLPDIVGATLTRAMLAAFAPEKLTAHDGESFDPFKGKLSEGRAKIGHYVEISKEGEWKGKRGVICQDDKDSTPYVVELADKTKTGYLKPSDLVSSGMSEKMCRTRINEAHAAAAAAMRAAIEVLPTEARDSLRALRERVMQDRLPLLSLLKAKPLEVQALHVSFQEYFAARAICTGANRLPEGSPPPWKWPSWWANAVRIGSEMGDTFGCGLLRTVGLGTALNLKEQLGGDRTTSIAAVVQMMRGLTSLDLSGNSLDAEEGKMLAVGLATSPSLTQVPAVHDIRVGVKGHNYLRYRVT